MQSTVLFRGPVWLATLLAASLAGLAQAAPAGAARPQVAAAVGGALAQRAEGALKAFYRARGDRPLWLESSGVISPAAAVLLDLVRSAQADGIDPATLEPDALAERLDRARSTPSEATLAAAELALSRTFVAYVEATRSADRAGMTYVAPSLAPTVPTADAVLSRAAAAPSLVRYLTDMSWMHSLYAPLRRALAASHDPAQAALLKANLARLRALPADPAARYVLVDAAGARLWMYENGKPIDSMKVVVGKPDNQTPMLAGIIRYAIVNPYWNVPVDLARNKIAPRVLQHGVRYLKAGGYEVMSDWSDDAHVVDPATIDWHAVADGKVELRVRQLPGADNFMGRVKFEFPNDFGIYLHDTPEMDLMAKPSRHYSSGCVRLQDAQRLGRWLMQKPLPQHVAGAEQKLDLPQAVPVYITYLTALPVNGHIVVQADSYGRDRPSFAGGSAASRSR